MEQPKQTKITSVDPIEGALDFFSTMCSSMLMGGQGKAGNKFTAEVKGIIIDTCKPLDTKIWETGILRPVLEGKWVIVSQYHSEAEAQQGHQEWLAYMTEHPDAPLKDIDCWNLGL